MKRREESKANENRSVKRQLKAMNIQVVALSCINANGLIYTWEYAQIPNANSIELYHEISNVFNTEFHLMFW